MRTTDLNRPISPAENGWRTQFAAEIRAPSITVTAEIAVPDLTASDPATAFGVALADGLRGASRRAFLLVHQGYGPRVIEMRDGDEVNFGRASESPVAIDDDR